MADDPTELTVLVPTWNGRELLSACLESLGRQTVPISVMVVDDGSTDGTADWVVENCPGVALVRLDRNRGFAAAVNEGLARVTTPYVALINNDAEADPGWAAHGLRALRESPAEFGFFASRMLQYDRPDLLDGAGDQYSRTGLPTKRGFGLPANRFPDAEEVMGACAGAAFYRMSMLRETGFFDEDYVMYLEDVELSLRARVLGHRCRYLAAAVVRHREAASDPDRGSETPADPGRGFYSDRRVFWITRNRWLLMVTYQPWRHLPWLAWGWAKSTLFHILRAGHTSAFFKGIRAGLAATPAAWRKRKELRRRRAQGMGEVWRLMT